MAEAIGILGGTFDPIHLGHLRIAVEIHEALGLREVRMIPCAQPPHRDQPVASMRDRLAMLRLATEGEPALIVDEREYHRGGPSYTVDTLLSLREEVGEVPLCLIVGSDSFSSLPSWHRWRQIMELAHIVLAYRPGWKSDEQTLDGVSISERLVEDPRRLQQQPGGLIFPWPVTQLDISATAIRQQVRAGGNIRYLVPDSVRAYIEEKKLYQ